MLAGAAPVSDEGIGKLRDAFLPGATCSISPASPVSSAAHMP